jgi:ABC-type phosphate transport system auxiliary subunit
MTKQPYDLEDNDFGFSAVSEEELRSIENQIKQELTQKSQELIQVEETYKGKLEQLYSAVMPLLQNLAQSPDKTYLYWPDRAVKMKAFISKVNTIVGK